MNIVSLEKSAYHEAGHVLVAMRWLGHVPREVSIYAVSNGKLGHAAIGVTSGPREALDDAQWRRIRVPEAAMFLAGLAAEEVAGFGRSAGISELETITRVQGRGAVNWAMTHGLPPVVDATDDVEGALAALIDAFPMKKHPLGRLLRVYSFSLAFLARSRPVLYRLATALATRAHSPWKRSRAPSVLTSAYGAPCPSTRQRHSRAAS
jgi:hypothetical protein